MKRLLSAALMVLASLVGMVGVSSAAADPAMQSVITQLKNIQQSLDAISSDQLQVTVNTTNGAVGTLQATVNAGVSASAKIYYLTKNSFDGGDAITACDSGFHMASLFEILDPSNLQYATSISSAYVHPALDQGSGPPTTHDGWLRTGFSSDPDPFSREDDCNLWTSRSSAFSGPTVQFLSTWDVLDTCPLSCKGWIPSTSTCASNLRVWCAEDPA